MLQDKETCRDLILSHIIKGKRLAADFKEGTANDETSGEMVTGANGKQFRYLLSEKRFKMFGSRGSCFVCDMDIINGVQLSMYFLSHLRIYSRQMVSCILWHIASR